MYANPPIGFLDLTGGNDLDLLSADKAAISPLFNGFTQSHVELPRCDVLFPYCLIEADGSVRNSSDHVRQLVDRSEAVVAVVASENAPAHCVAAIKRGQRGKANLVVTLNRRGDIFPRFFERLFIEMKRGVSMPVAWNRLAPQTPRGVHPDCPDTIFLCEAGKVMFA
jgi:hypothetical protein